MLRLTAADPLPEPEALTIEQRHDKLPYLAELHFIPIVWAQYVVRQAMPCDDQSLVCLFARLPICLFE